MQPNILWFCSDQQRWDTIHALGNNFIRTPNIDSLLRKGLTFERTYSQSPICTPARATFMTGRYPAAHHVYRNGNDYFPAHEKLVSKYFAEAGYDCGLVGKLHLSAAKKYERRPDDGYRVFLWSQHPAPDALYGHDYENWLKFEKGVDPQQLYSPVNYFCGPGVPSEYNQTTWCVEMAVRFVSERRQVPWFLSVNPFAPHAPFHAPPEALEKVDASSLPLPKFRESDLAAFENFRYIDQQTRQPVDPRIRRELTNDAPKSHDQLSAAANDYDALQVKANYYAMIEHLDEQFGRLVQVLADTKQLDNTIVIFCSDHGEMLGDHGIILKGCRFFEGLVRVPLIISWPGRFLQDRRSDALVELVDLAPTLMEAAGMDVPYSMQGKSLVPLLSGNADINCHKKTVVSEFRDSLGQQYHSQGSMVFDGRYKSIFYQGQEIAELFDLENDPDEFDNLWLQQGNDNLKLRQLRHHHHAMMATVPLGPHCSLPY